MTSRSVASNAIKDNDLGYSLGFGVDGFATTHFGVQSRLSILPQRQRGRLRATSSGVNFDAGNFSFSRGTVGAIFRF